MLNLENTVKGMPKAKALKPFGNGVRACLGQHFAMQQAKLAIASLFQRFDFEFCDQLYELKHKQRIALQPDGFKIFAKLRQEGVETTNTTGIPLSVSQVPSQPSSPTSQPTALQRIYILWGGQGGTCETYAQTLSRWAPAYS
jgi:cytochrome P450/NADPH-cytochrome P450 reductase